jgi:hypothetical protein
LKEDRNYALAEPGQEVLFGAEKARGAWAASVRKETRPAQGKGEHEVAHDDATREEERKELNVAYGISMIGWIAQKLEKNITVSR